MRTPRFRRPRLSYANVTATLALVIATSMGGAYAHGKIGSEDIKKNAVKSRHIAAKNVKTPDLARKAVTTDRIKNQAVTKAKLAPSARTVTRYTSGPHDFIAVPSFFLELPGVTAGQVTSSEWSIQVVYANGDVAIVDYDFFDGQGAYMKTVGGVGGVQFNGFNELGNVAQILVFRTAPLTSELAAPRVVRRGTPGGP